MRESGGNRQLERARPHNRPEPARPLRPTRLARVPGARRPPDTTSRSSAPRGPETPTTRSSTGWRSTSTAPTRAGQEKWGISSSTSTRSVRRLGSSPRCGAARGSTRCRHAIRLTSSGRSVWRSGSSDGSRFVFDHHDLCPELYESRFPDGSRAAYWGLRALELCTFTTARHVISTNESYRSKALERGSKKPEDVTVVRTGPDSDRLRARDRRALVAPGSAVPRGLHRCDGTPGRRRRRRPCGRRDRPRARAHRYRVHRDRQR